MSKSIGTKGESIAEKYLLSSGYTVLTVNYHSYFGEIDLVCRKDNDIIFVEVKNYKKNSLRSPLQSVTKNKQKKIIKTAKKYLMENYLENAGVRFDVLIVESGKIIEHLEGAFCL